MFLGNMKTIYNKAAKFSKYTWYDSKDIKKET
jgi:hypothetical protein